MNLDEFNNLTQKDGLQNIKSCCTSTNWAKGFITSRPFSSLSDALEKSLKVWNKLSTEDFLEAFDGHPKIGDVNSLKEKYRDTKSLATNEQSGMEVATDQIIKELADLNNIYCEKFGFIFIVCATGKSAKEMLDILKSRIDNTKEEEIVIAASEQVKITAIRLEKLLCPL